MVRKKKPIRKIAVTISGGKKASKKLAPLKSKPSANAAVKSPLKKSLLSTDRRVSIDESYRSLLNTIGEAIFILNSHTTIVDVNDAACAMYGYQKKELVGKTPEFLSADKKNDYSTTSDKIKKAFRGVPQIVECWGQRKNKELFLKELKLKRGTYFGTEVIIATARDLMARQQIEEALRESEQRYKTLQQASFGGIGMHDKGIIIDCNQGLCDITGYSRKELIGFNGLNLIAPEWRKYVMEKILSGTEKPYDVEGIHKDGSRFFLEVQAKNIPYKGKVIRVTEFRDITERKVAEGRIKEQNTKLTTITEDLRRKNDQLEEFTQIVSHNLRSPMGNILTLIGFLESAVSDDERTEYLTLLKESGLTAQQTLLELHEVLKIKQNKKIPRQLLNFIDVFNHVESMLSARITEVSAKVETDFSDAPTLLYPNIYLESILLNLLSNSLKYIRANIHPVICFKSYKQAGSIVLEVTDNGAGINLDRYGHQVFKLHKTFHRHPESRGIGLFMIKNQIEALGGDISMTSKENKGTTVFITFDKHQFDEPEGTHNSNS